MRRPLHLACLTALAILTASSLAQTPGGPGQGATEARYAGGFRPEACRWPRGARQQQLSACCQMELSIDAAGRMRSGEGVCTDPAFLEPTLRCLAAQTFIPATRNGRPVPDVHRLEYEWRASKPSGNLCAGLKTS